MNRDLYIELTRYYDSPFTPYSNPLDYFLGEERLSKELRGNMAILSATVGTAKELPYLLCSMAVDGESGEVNIAVEKYLSRVALELSKATSLSHSAKSCFDVNRRSFTDALTRSLGGYRARAMNGDGELTPSFIAYVANALSLVSAGASHGQFFHNLHCMRETYLAELLTTEERGYHSSSMVYRQRTATRLYLEKLAIGKESDPMSIARFTKIVSNLDYTFHSNTSSEILLDFLRGDHSTAIAAITMDKIIAEHPELNIFPHHGDVTPERIKEFLALAEEYNVEWALASFEWRKSVTSPMDGDG